ncbi:hypothetical protein VKT23_007319 [Stygiomarasmius scandens]|uniref:DUF6535 domain-containing protein n=1 Tax=Marasmiellus scandens TaxID=2682957 RepID=A0ABR1JKC3_9AGAR
MSQDPARDSSIDVEKGGIETKPTVYGRFKPTADDDACFKLWNTYIEQAQDYDYKLLEGWKGDMDGMLLFSALYSATLTALIVESYQKLQQDPADATLAVLTQVSRQLALLSNGTTAPFQDLPAFELEPSVLICNMLWFLSLALALTCSLLATFVQQWVRDFLHKTTIRPSPVVQARVLAFSYFGLRRFGLHTFVDIIPILLHLSLFLFFAGLVAFLLPINRPLMYLLVGVLIVFMLVYTGLSCMPLIWLDAPYRTPVSDLLWRVGNRLRGFFFQAHKLPEDLSLTEAMVETSLKDSSERDRRCMKYTLKSLNHDTELLPMLGAISEAILGPTGIRFDNATLIFPLLQAADAEENIVSRISHFVSVSGTSTDPAQQQIDKFISLKALWSLARLAVDHSTEKPCHVVYETTVFWFERGLLDVLAKSSFASDSRMISALALIRTSRLQSLRRCIDTVAEKLSLRNSSSSDQLRLAKDAFDNVTPEDVNWTSALFMNQFSELSNVLREGSLPDLSESRAHELVPRANALIRGLQNPGRWKAAIISVLSGFLSNAAEAKLVPFEVGLTHKLICSSIPRVDVFDQSLEVEDDEAEASLLLQNTSQYPSSVPPELFIHIFQLAFSTERALSIPKCRGIALLYLYNLDRRRNLLIDRDIAGHLEQCILQDLRDDDAFNSGFTVVSIRSLYLGLGLENYSTVSPRLLRFAKQIFELTPTVSARFTQDRWWNPRKLAIEWVFCKDILPKLGGLNERLLGNSDLSPSDSQTLDNICCLGGRLLPGVPVPTRPSSCTANEHKQWGQEIQTYVMSMNLLIFSKFVDLTMEDTGGIFLGDWIWMQYYLFYHSGDIYGAIQLQFAQSVQKLVSLTPWNQQKDTPAFQVFHQWIWRLSIYNWCWITDVESAKILLEAIERHTNDKNYRGWIWHERELFDRCTQVIQKVESKQTTIMH